MRKNLQEYAKQQAGNPQPPQSDDVQANRCCPIVSIDVTTRGIESLRPLLEKLPCDSGASFLVFLDGNDQHGKQLTESLRAASGMTVLNYQDGQPLLPNHIYTVKPGHKPALPKNHYCVEHTSADINPDKDGLQARIEQLERANNDFENLLSSTDVATIFLDSDLKLRWFTPHITRLLRVTLQDTGRYLKDIAPRFSDKELVADARKVLTDHVMRQTEVRIDDDQWLLRRILPYRTQDGCVDGVVISFVPMTELIQAQLRLRDREKKLSLALHAGKMGTWAWNLETNRVEWDAQQRRLIGLDPLDTRDSLNRFWESVHPEDRDDLDRQVKAAVRGEKEFDNQFRVILPSGETRWLAGRAHIVKNESDNHRWMIGVNYDITEHYHNLEQAQRLARIVESSYNAIIAKDMDGNVLSWNRGAERIYGYTQEEAVGQHVNFIVPKDKHEEWNSVWVRIRAGETVKPFHTQRVTKDGHRIHVMVTISPYDNGSGRLIGVSSISRDITDEIALEMKYASVKSSSATPSNGRRSRSSCTCKTARCSSSTTPGSTARAIR